MPQPKPISKVSAFISGHKAEVIIGLVGLAIALYGIHASKASSSGAVQTTTPDSSTGVTSGNGSTGTTTGMDPIAAAIQVAQIDANTAIQEAQIAAEHAGSFTFGQTNSSTLNAQNQGSSSSSSGGSFLGLFSFGGGGGSSHNQTLSESNAIQTGFSATGLTDAELTALEQLVGGLETTQNNAENNQINTSTGSQKGAAT